jgi:hypothetical protein
MTTVDVNKGESGYSEPVTVIPVSTGREPSTPALTWAVPAAVVEGTALSGAQLNATASVAGTFAYSPAAGTVLAVGTHTLTASFTPTDTTHYTTATATVSLVVSAAPRTTPTLTWAAPASVVEGTALGATQLNATASVAGTFTYLPAAGTLLAVGTHTLTATFTPTDTTRYTTATASTSLTVMAPSTSTSGPSEPPPDTGSLQIGAPYTLSIVRPSGGVVKGININCGTTAKACSMKAPGPMTMTLQARADRGYVFLGWTEHCSGSSSTYALALEGPRTCGATFAPVR